MASEENLIRKIKKARDLFLAADSKNGKMMLDELLQHSQKEKRLEKHLREINSSEWEDSLIVEKLNNLIIILIKEQGGDLPEKEGDPVHHPESWIHYPVSDWSDYLDKGSSLYRQDGIYYDASTDKKVEMKEVTNFKAALYLLSQDKLIDLLGFDSDVFKKWQEGEIPSANEERKVLYLANAIQSRGVSWFKKNEERRQALLAWEDGPVPSVLESEENGKN